jgi:anti-sigma factor RsiW
MNCAKFEPLIALSVENDLIEAEALPVAAHLEACGGCRELAARMRESQAALKMLRAEFLENAVYQSVRGEVLSRVSRRCKPATWRRFAIAAGLAIALIAGWQAGTRPIASLELPRQAAVIPKASLVAFQAPAAPPRLAHVHRRYRLRPAFKSEPLVVKMITDDPQVVIYWLVDQNGG